jgi:hypothetical protein
MSGAFPHQLAQVGVGGDFSKGVVYVTAIVLGYFWLVVIASGLLIWGLVTIRRTRGKLLAGGAAAMLAALLGGAYVVLNPPPPPIQNVTLDFSSSRTPPPGRWDKFQDMAWLNYEGRIDLKLSLPNGLVYDDLASLVTLERCAERIVNVHINVYGLSQKQALALERKYANWQGAYPGTLIDEKGNGTEWFASSIELRGPPQGSWSIHFSALWHAHGP